MSTTASVLEHHLEAFGDGDLDEVMADYTDDSVLITGMGVFRGPDEIEGLFEDLLAEFSAPGATMTVDEQVVEGDYAYIQWHGETPDNVYEFATDTFVIREGTIEAQTFAGEIVPVD